MLSKIKDFYEKNSSGDVCADRAFVTVLIVIIIGLSVLSFIFLDNILGKYEIVTVTVMEKEYKPVSSKTMLVNGKVIVQSIPEKHIISVRDQNDKVFSHYVSKDEYAKYNTCDVINIKVKIGYFSNNIIY